MRNKNNIIAKYETANGLLGGELTIAKKTIADFEYVIINMKINIAQAIEDLDVIVNTLDDDDIHEEKIRSVMIFLKKIID